MEDAKRDAILTVEGVGTFALKVSELIVTPETGQSVGEDGHLELAIVSPGTLKLVADIEVE